LDYLTVVKRIGSAAANFVRLPHGRKITHNRDDSCSIKVCIKDMRAAGATISPRTDRSRTDPDEATLV
jgi:hypothetical protein